MIVVYGIAFFTIPFMISFVIMDYEVIRLDKVNIFIYMMCWFDIVVTCITGYYDKKDMRVELRSLKILKYDLTYFRSNHVAFISLLIFFFQKLLKGISSGGYTFFLAVRSHHFNLAKTARERFFSRDHVDKYVTPVKAYALSDPK